MDLGAGFYFAFGVERSVGGFQVDAGFFEGAGEAEGEV
jgi:hypothetical protein